jgi:hypothetical protein
MAEESCLKGESFLPVARYFEVLESETETEAETRTETETETGTGTETQIEN